MRHTTIFISILYCLMVFPQSSRGNETELIGQDIAQDETISSVIAKCEALADESLMSDSDFSVNGSEALSQDEWDFKYNDCLIEHGIDSDLDGFNSEEDTEELDPFEDTNFEGLDMMDDSDSDLKDLDLIDDDLED